jgi:hypothetical protein
LRANMHTWFNVWYKPQHRIFRSALQLLSPVTKANVIYTSTLRATKIERLKCKSETGSDVSIPVTEGIEKSHTDKYKRIMNDWNYDASCTITSLPVSDLENFKRLIFVAQSAHSGQLCLILY